MKTMTCNKLGGACDKTFAADTFDEMAEMSRAHGQKMSEQNDEAHTKAMANMMELMKDPAAMTSWMASKRADFEKLAND